MIILQQNHLYLFKLIIMPNPKEYTGINACYEDIALKGALR